MGEAPGITRQGKLETACAGRGVQANEGVLRGADCPDGAAGHAIEAEIALAGPLESPGMAGFRQALWSKYIPNKVVAACAPDDTAARLAIPLLAGRDLVDGQPAAYVCQNFACDLPVTEPVRLLERLGV